MKNGCPRAAIFFAVRAQQLLYAKARLCCLILEYLIKAA